MFDLPEALLLARIQFAFTVSFHFLFPAITIGLASYLAVLDALYDGTAALAALCMVGAVYFIFRGG